MIETPHAPSIGDSQSVPIQRAVDDKSVEELARELKILVRDDRARRAVRKQKAG